MLVGGGGGVLVSPPLLSYPCAVITDDDISTLAVHVLRTLNGAGKPLLLLLLLLPLLLPFHTSTADDATWLPLWVLVFFIGSGASP